MHHYAGETRRENIVCTSVRQNLTHHIECVRYLCTTEHVDTGAARIVFNGFERRILIHELESPCTRQEFLESDHRGRIAVRCSECIVHIVVAERSKAAYEPGFGHILWSELDHGFEGTYFLGEIAQVSEDYRLAWRQRFYRCLRCWPTDIVDI